MQILDAYFSSQEQSIVDRASSIEYVRNLNWL